MIVWILRVARESNANVMCSKSDSNFFHCLRMEKVRHEYSFMVRLTRFQVSDLIRMFEDCHDVF